MTDRELRGLDIFYQNRITRNDDGVWLVPSQTTLHKLYHVRFNGREQTCPCEDFKANKPKWCKHLWAVHFKLNQQAGQALPERPRIFRSKKRDYPRDWAEYNDGKLNEKPKFRELLYDLCRDLPEPPASRNGGRPRISASDLMFAAVYKIYERETARGVNDDLQTIFRDGYISQVPRASTILNCFSAPGMTEILMHMIRRSTASLRLVETKVTADSTSFPLSRYERWFDPKLKRYRRRQETVKAHLMCGIKTHVITSVTVTHGSGPDSPEFPHLLNDTGKRYRVLEVFADTAYCSRENFECADEIGAVAFFDFRKGASGASGGLFKKMYHFFQLRRDEFIDRFNVRSNAEAVHSMLDRRFKGPLFSKTGVAIKNEVLCRCLIHNICCVVMNLYQLGIEPEFYE